MYFFTTDLGSSLKKVGGTPFLFPQPPKLELPNLFQINSMEL